MAGAALRIARAVAIPVVLATIAEVAARASGFASDSLAPPSAVLVAFATAFVDGTMLAATSHTLLCAAGGLALGGGIGFLIGVAAGAWHSVDRTLSLSVEAIRPVPPVALVPIALLVFGFGVRMEVACIAFGCLWPVLILTRSAVAGIEPALTEVARSLRLGALASFVKITFPAALPRVLVAIRLAAGIALVIAVTAEITGNPRGLGYDMMVAEQTLRPDVMLAYLLWIGILGWTINATLLRAQIVWLGAAARTGSA